MGHVAFRAGQVVGGRYRLGTLLGFGAMGAVWSARDELDGRHLAVKFMHSDVQPDAALARRFVQEAEASVRLRHPGIVEAYGLGFLDEEEAASCGLLPGSPFLVMELLQGEPLSAVLQRGRALPVGTALEIVRDLAHALEVAHAAGIVHRDLKPANVFLHRTPSGTIVPKILDFGVAKLVDLTATSVTTLGRPIGSPAYMSPEQVLGAPDVDARADLWSLGVLLYTCIEGERPFGASAEMPLLDAIVHTRHAPISGEARVPDRVRRLVDECLEKAPRLRPPSARALATEIERVLAEVVLQRVPLSSIVRGEAPDGAAFEDGLARDGATTIAPPRTTAPTARPPRGHRARIAFGAAALALVLASAAIVVTYARRAAVVNVERAPISPAPAASPAPPASSPSRPSASAEVDPPAAPPAAPRSASPRRTSPAPKRVRRSRETKAPSAPAASDSLRAWRPDF